jgi:hypothetical protein
MGAEQQSVSAEVAHSVCWRMCWILFMLFHLALVDKLCILFSANFHDADVIDVVNAPFAWVCD